MCFSATVSFTAGTSLSLVGILSLSYAHSLKQRMLAAIPLFFGIQQIAEGIVWKGMQNNNDLLITYGAYTFLFFAFFFWPVWVPLTMYTIEPNKKRRIVLAALTVLGLGLGMYLVQLAINNRMFVQMFDCHIMYGLAREQTYLVETILYLIATVVPCFIVLNPWVNLMGAAIAASYLITYFFYTQVLVSVWCFFVAIISFFSIVIIHTLNHTHKRKR